jgi:hypothetical protein
MVGLSNDLSTAPTSKIDCMASTSGYSLGQVVSIDVMVIVHMGDEHKWSLLEKAARI